MALCAKNKKQTISKRECIPINAVDNKVPEILYLEMSTKNQTPINAKLHAGCVLVYVVHGKG